MAGELGGPERQRTACRLLIATCLAIFLIDWGCSMWAAVDSDPNGNAIRLKTPGIVKVYLDRPPGLEESDR